MNIHIRYRDILMQLPILLFLFLMGSSIYGDTDFSSANILVGAEISYPPYSFVDESGNPIGFSIDLLKNVLDTMNVSYQYRVDHWSIVKAALENGEVDVLPLVGRTPEREEIFDFTIPYLTMHGTTVVKAGSEHPSSLKDLEGMNVAVLKGDNAEEYVTRSEVEFNLISTDTYETALELLSSGDVNAVVIQHYLALQLLDDLELDDLEVSGNFLPGFSQSFCFAVQEGNKELLQLLNEGLSISMSDGTFDHFFELWFSIHGKFNKDRKIIVGGDSSFPPFEYLDNSGNPAGFNVDLTNAIAELMNLNVEIRLAPWPQTYNDLRFGKVDMIQGLYYSLERDKIFSFSQPHSKIKHVVITNKNSLKIGDIKDFKDKKILVLQNDLMHEYLLKEGFSNNIIPEERLQNIVLRLSRGEADCAVVAQIPASYWIDKFNIDNLKIQSFSFESSEYNFGALEQNSDLLLDFKEGLTVLQMNGQYREIYTKWLNPYNPDAQGGSSNILKIGTLILAISLLIVFFMIYVSTSLKKKVNRRTQQLKDSEMELAERRENFRRAIELSPYPIMIQTEEGLVLNLNKKWIETTGYQLKDIPTRKDWILKASGSNFEEIKDYIDMSEFYNVPFFNKGEFSIRASDGETFIWDFNTVSLGFNQHNQNIIMTTAHDLTEIRKNEQNLRKLKQAIEQSPVSILITDYNGEIEFANKMTSITSGFELGEIIGENPRIFKSSKTELETYRDLWETIKSGETWKKQITNKKKNGDEVIENVTISPVYDNQGDIINFIATRVDITKEIEKEFQRIELEKQLHQKSKMDVIGQLAGGIAHDFNNVLNGIVNASHLLKSSLPNGDTKSENYLSIIDKASNRAVALSNKLLSFSREEEIIDDVFDVHTLIEEVQDVLSGLIDQRIKIELDLSAHYSLLSGNATDIHTSILNLCLNASHAIDSGGFIKIQTSNVEYLESTIVGSFDVLAGNYIRLDILDDGNGIEADHIPKIFEPFFTTKPVGAGTGLGLSTVYGAVSRHKGFIDVSSTVGEGTRFSIFLPRSNDLKLEAGNNIEAKSKHADLESKVILIVDDEEINRIVLSDLLESLGFSSFAAKSGLEAIDIYIENGNDIDAVILDFMMPDLNGKETFEQLRMINSQAKIILSSGFSDHDDIEIMKKNGLFSLLKKPFSVDDLEAVLSTL